mmetsp:Transcript_45633/g.121317  ORF Transcript_45633/g.121317 Transcript_45633/m.121317 type:complete len:129 (+) Transcript_45633:502-888(+)
MMLSSMMVRKVAATKIESDVKKIMKLPDRRKRLFDYLTQGGSPCIIPLQSCKDEPKNFESDPTWASYIDFLECSLDSDHQTRYSALTANFSARTFLLVDFWNHSEAQRAYLSQNASSGCQSTSTTTVK